MFSTSKRKSNILADLGPLYHSYSFLGVDNEQISGIYAPNQKVKSPIITAYIAQAIAKCAGQDEHGPSFTELFCADGYYAMIASRLGCHISIGIDNNSDKHFEKAEVIAERLGLTGCQFIQSEITTESSFARTDIVANLGGLYHVEDPAKILENSYHQAIQYLIVQSVVSLAVEDDSYFESPAPGWTWGCRFSRSSFHKMMMSVCPNIVDHHFNELPGNERPEDRGSVYYLIKR